MSLEEYKGVYVFAQQVDGEVSGIAYELLGKAKDLAKDLNTDVTAVLIGYNVKGLVDGLAQYGADKVIVVDDKELEVYRTEPYTHALASVINEYKPEIVLVGATAIGRDLGPRVSARVATGLTADCTVLEIGDFNDIASKQVLNNQLLMTRPAFGGNTIATIACPFNRPQMATVRPGVMQKIDPIKDAKAEVIEFNPGFTPDNKYVEILEVVKSVSDTVDIADAKILVSGGRGVGSKENFKMLQDLADVFGGMVSCSRAAVENGADLIELGIPFSDPTAEGPVIQGANIRALNGGVTTDKIFAFVKKLRYDVKVPMVFMTYSNVVFSYGAEKFISTCKNIEIDGLILPDLPFEEKEEFLPLCHKYGVDLVSLIAPTSENRIAMIAKEAEGFLYIVSSLGVTGTRSEIKTDLTSIVKVVRENTGIPCAIGFGISTPEQAKKMADIADGAIVGSAIIKLLEKYGKEAPNHIGKYIKSMKDAMR